MSIPDTSQADAVLPALADFPFPTALVVTGAPAADDGVLLEAGEVDEVFPFASVTKPIVAWAALVAVERGLLDLDAPAGPPAPEGAAIGNLLSHSSGIAADSDERLAAPGVRRIYSNRGFEILGDRLQEATATPLETWVEATVLEPLGMASVLIPGSPAHSGEGSARDLSLFARELAAPRLVSPALAARACAPVLPGLDGVLPGYGRQTPNSFGLGVEVRGSKSPHWTSGGNSPQTFGHFGQSGSFIWVDPVAERQAVFLGAEPFGALHRKTWPALGDQILALSGDHGR
ncbi:penicillin-binding protein [Actinomyces viscosus]|uniref:Putative periplasmic esterase n=1 Tax=Actinomyces viscosus TaxID=1656 RepID=A0A448PM95_ACTVI|nr:serine hydrolase domain-containing protein [Actinomyces viscosus]TFH51478.1 penicillin-binding protein [Actinomyces viscosus]VEI16795.1 putative periplasmic esterase [Actinomyces viscosus]